MARNKFDISKLDTIIKKTIEAISNSKGQIYDIAEGSKKECKRLEEELNDLKEQLKQMFDIIDILEHDLKVSRSRLAMLSKKFTDRSDEELQKAYEKADNIRIQLVIKREQEQNLIVRRNELEIRLKDAYKTVEKAEDLMSQIGIALGYLTGDLVNLSSHIEDMQQCGLLGIKIIRAQEDERQRVARDIHDGPAQSMSNVVLKAEICEKLLDVDIDRVKGELRELKMVVRGCLQDIRRIIYDL